MVVVVVVSLIVVLIVVGLSGKSDKGDSMRQSHNNEAMKERRSVGNLGPLRGSSALFVCFF